MTRWRECAVRVGTCGAAALLLLPARAESDLSTIGDYHAWSAASFTADNVRNCYAVSKPAESIPTNVRRGEIHVTVSRRSSASGDELILASGYPYRKGSVVEVRIGTSSFTLTTAKEFAWVPGEGVEPLVKAMMGGQEMVVEGISARGTETTDTYSLLGFTAAYQAIARACN